MSESTPITFEIVPATAGIAPEQKLSLERSFLPSFQELERLKVEAGKATTPQDARVVRLELVKVRTGADKVRKELKEASLREGRAIDGANAILLNALVPIEKAMESIEKEAERKEKAAMDARIAERTEKLNNVGAMVPSNLGWLTDDQFAAILKDAAELQRIRAEREEKERVERLAQIEADRIERERIAAENERLKAEAAENARLAKIESDRIAAERAEERRLAQLEIEKIASERAEEHRLAQIETKRIAAEIAKKEEIARQERIKAEAKANAEREQLEAEAAKARKELEEVNARAAAVQEEARRVQKLEAAAKAKAAKAPDSAKLAILLTSIKSLSIPSLTTDEGKQAVAKIRAILNNAYAQIKAVSAEF